VIHAAERLSVIGEKSNYRQEPAQKGQIPARQLDIIRSKSHTIS
jgi:hypothetical protein